MVILKIPIVYLCWIVIYAIRAEPSPDEGAAIAVRLGPDDSGSGWSRWAGVPWGPVRTVGPSRTYARSPRAALARANGPRR